MTTTKREIPQIRFKGFSENWEENELGNKVKFFSGLTYSPNDIVKQNGTLVLRSSNIKSGMIVNADNVYVNSEVVNCDNVQKGDIAVVVRNGSRALIGKHAQIQKKMKNTVLGAFMTGIRYEYSSFLNALLDSSTFNKEIEKNLGATINQITNSAFKKMIFLFPEETEQTEVGKYFYQLDNLIEQKEKKHQKLKQLKQAMLYKMFPKNGLDTPEVRFKGFSENWEERELGEITFIGTGRSSFKVTSVKSDVNPYAILGSRAIIGYDCSFDYSGDFILTARVGENAGKLYQYSGKVKISDNTVFIKSQNLNFIFYLLQKYDLQKLSFGTGQPLIKASELNNLKLLFPVDKVEQEKIGNYFQKLDKQIDLQFKEIEKLKNIKKASLDKMFV